MTDANRVACGGHGNNSEWNNEYVLYALFLHPYCLRTYHISSSVASVRREGAKKILKNRVLYLKNSCVFF